MESRFANLKRIPPAPAARMLALANAKLSYKLTSPASASVSDVLQELDAAKAYVDIIRLFSIALPTRQAIWWACLAGRDIVGKTATEVPLTLVASESWVFKPTDDLRETARQAAEMAEMDDETVLCATAVSMCDGKLGTGSLAEYDAPAGGCAAAVFGMNILSLSKRPEIFEQQMQYLIERAIHIGQGGDGRLPDPVTPTTESEAPLEEPSE